MGNATGKQLQGQGENQYTTAIPSHDTITQMTHLSPQPDDLSDPVVINARWKLPANHLQCCFAPVSFPNGTTSNTKRISNVGLDASTTSDARPCLKTWIDIVKRHT